MNAAPARYTVRMSLGLRYSFLALFNDYIFRHGRGIIHCMQALCIERVAAPFNAHNVSWREVLGGSKLVARLHRDMHDIHCMPLRYVSGVGVSQK